MAEQVQEFGKWRSYLWPVHSYELKKVVPMLLMFFFVLFNYQILRDTKDALIVPSSGAEAIPFLKFWGVVPGAIFFMLIYSKLSNILSKENLFYATIAPFLVFFGCFALFIYPNKDVLHPHATADYLKTVLPLGLNGLIECFRNWTYSLFYVLSELWGSAVLSLLFWGFANDITRVGEAKRFYSLFGLGANFSLPVAGKLIKHFSLVRDTLPQGVDAWGYTLNWLMLMVVIAGLTLVAVYWWIQRYVLTDKRFFDPSEEKKAKKAKPKMSIMDSLKYIFSSKYMLCLAAIVIAYGMSINIVEITFKDQLKKLYPNPNDYSYFMGGFTEYTGYLSIFMMLFVGSNVIRRLGWGVAAQITPVILLLTGTAFFGFIIFKDSHALAGIISVLGMTPLYLAVMFGATQNIMTKATKYSLFDPTKEMAYIPLDQEQKVKGKAAIDVVAARFGKSGGSVIQQGLLFVFVTVTAYTPYVAGVLFLVIGGWIFASRYLGKEFYRLTNTGETPGAAQEKEELETASAT